MSFSIHMMMRLSNNSSTSRASARKFELKSVVWVLLCTKLSLSQAQSRRPNFVVFQPDDMDFFDDWDPPGRFNGVPTVDYPANSDLPNINRLRKNGLHMRQAYTTSPMCGTSRYSTLTGRYPSRSSRSRFTNSGLDVADVIIPNTKIEDRPYIPDGMDCSSNNVAAQLKSNGYRTGVVGKWHLTDFDRTTYSYEGMQQSIRNCGFDYAEAIYPHNFPNPNWYSGGFSHNMEYITWSAIEFIEQNEDEPFFLYMNPTAPHWPSVLEALTYYTCMQTPAGHYGGPDLSIVGMTAEYGDSCEEYRQSVIDRAGGPFAGDNALASVWIDDAVGAVVRTLEKIGQLNNTFFLFQLDHGYEGKGSLHEAGVRIPQFIHYPDGLGTQAREFHGLVSTIDIGATILDYAGLDRYPMDGKSWKEAVVSNNTVDEEAWKSRCLYFEIGTDRAVRCGCDKYFDLTDYDGRSRTKSKARWYGAFHAEKMFFHLCDDSGKYIDASASVETPENGSELFKRGPNTTNPVAEELQEMIDCHLKRTHLDNVGLPDYKDDCYRSLVNLTTMKPMTRSFVFRKNEFDVCIKEELAMHRRMYDEAYEESAAADEALDIAEHAYENALATRLVLRGILDDEKAAAHDSCASFIDIPSCMETTTRPFQETYDESDQSFGRAKSDWEEAEIVKENAEEALLQADYALQDATVFAIDKCNAFL